MGNHSSAIKSDVVVERLRLLLGIECDRAKKLTSSHDGVQSVVTISVRYKNGSPICVDIGGDKFTDMKMFCSSY